MTSRYLHTMLRVTDPQRSRQFYEALGMEFRRESPIVRNGELEATLYFYGFPGQEEELELTFNHDGSTYDLGSGYGHVAIGVDDLDTTLASLAEQGIEPEKPPYQVREGGSWLCFVRDPDSYLRTLIRFLAVAPRGPASPSISEAHGRAGGAVRRCLQSNP